MPDEIKLLQEENNKLVAEVSNYKKFVDDLTKFITGKTRLYKGQIIKAMNVLKISNNIN